MFVLNTTKPALKACIFAMVELSVTPKEIEQSKNNYIVDFKLLQTESRTRAQK